MGSGPGRDPGERYFRYLVFIAGGDVVFRVFDERVAAKAPGLGEVQLACTLKERDLALAQAQYRGCIGRRQVSRNGPAARTVRSPQTVPGRTDNGRRMRLDRDLGPSAGLLPLYEI